MMKQKILLFVFFLTALSSYGQVKFDVVKAGDNYISTGSEALSSLSSEKAFANAILWIVDRATSGKDNIVDCDMDGKTVTAKLRMAQDESSKQAYTCEVKVTVSSGQVVVLAENIKSLTGGLFGETVLAFEKLNIEKKDKHKEMFNEFKRLANKTLNQMLKYIQTNDPGNLSHWSQVCSEELIPGMTENECKIAKGKPLSVSGGAERTQWMYSTSEYLIFTNGLLKAHIK